MSPVIGVILLEADHSVETLDLPDPFAWEPPPGLGAGFFGHPDAWPLPTLFAVARGATAAASAEAAPEALQGVADAVARLDGRCDVIVGGCGFFAWAWPVLEKPPVTPTVLSGLDLLDVALRATSRDVAVLSFSAPPAERFVATRPDLARVRVVGISPAGDWPLIGRPDWATNPQWTIEGVEAGVREVLAGGVLDDVGGVVIECTVLPQFRSVIREYTAAPIYEAGDFALSLLR
jgi:hypothetical protein